MWRGQTGSWYTIGNYFGNQYGWTAASAQTAADVLRTTSKVALGAGLLVSGASYYKDINKGNTLMAIRDSIDVPMGAAALEFPFGTAVSGIWFGGELLYDLHEINPYIPMPMIY